jgi:hypothetical protein
MENDFMNAIKKQKKEDLIWLDTETGEKFHAGVAFFLEDFGEYRLILDAPRTVLYLRPHKAHGDEINYLVHAPIDVNGKFSHRVEVGNGYSGSETNNHIYMKLGRYANQRLVLLNSER